MAKFRNAVGKVTGAARGEEESPTIKVCVRLRPFIQEEVSGSRSGGKCELCVAMPTQTSLELAGRPDVPQRTFEFDRCYWSHDENHKHYASQETLQVELGETMLQHALNGFNNCIFAYGQTGSGKSFSVLGGEGEARGLLPRIVEGLFRSIGESGPDTTFKTEVSFLEIYNEQLCDLIAQRDPLLAKEEKKLEVKQHPVFGTYVQGLNEAPVGSLEEVMHLVHFGASMRHISATKMNASSSRSHCIFSFKITVQKDGSSRMSQTHLVDLAGSERAGRTKAKGDRLKEGAAINQSLSTLARVISDLSKGGKKGVAPPFRNSKLTYILKESLCGNSKTIMMAAISPSLVDYDETLSTLKFAQSAKQVQTRAVANRVSEADLEKKLRGELEKLRAEMAASQTCASNRVHAAVQKEIEEKERLCQKFGKDWNSLVAEERQRMKKRRAMMEAPLGVSDPQALQLSPRAEGEQPDTTSSEGSSEQKVVHCPIVMLDSGEQDEPSGLLASASERSAIVITGKLATLTLEDRGGPAEATEVAAQFHAGLLQCRLDAKAAEAEFGASAPGRPKMQLAVIVALVTESTGTVNGELLVHVTHDDAAAVDTAFGREWLSWAQLRHRLDWLRSPQSAAKDRAIKMSKGNTWRAASRVFATSPALAEKDDGSCDGADDAPEEKRAELEAARQELATWRAKVEARSNAEHGTKGAHLRRARNAVLEKTQQAEKDLEALRSQSTEDLASLKEKFDRVEGELSKYDSTADTVQKLRENLETTQDRLKAETERTASLRKELAEERIKHSAAKEASGDPASLWEHGESLSTNIFRSYGYVLTALNTTHKQLEEQRTFTKRRPCSIEEDSDDANEETHD